MNHGDYDGFGIGRSATRGRTRCTRSDRPRVLAGRDYVLSDNYFCSVGGPSYPNHLFFVAGTSGGVLDNLENIETREMENGRQFKSWGCDAVGEDVFVLVKDERGT